MEYALIKFNDEIRVKIPGFGYVPCISYYPELWELYLEKLQIQSEHLIELIKGLNAEENREEILYLKLQKIEKLITKKIRALGIPEFFPSIKVEEKDGLCRIKDLNTGEQAYVPTFTFNMRRISEFEAYKLRSVQTIKKRKIGG